MVIRKAWSFLGAASLLALGSQYAAAASVGIHFEGNTTSGVTGTAGVVNQGSWNNQGPNSASGSGSNLLDSTGTATNVADTFSSNDGWSAGTFEDAGSTTQDNVLMSGYIDITPSVIITGIPYATYNVYAYVGSDGNGRTGNGAISGATTGNSTLTFTTASNGVSYPSGFVINSDPTNMTNPAVNVLLFQGVSGSSFTYTGTSISSNTGLNGIQIVDTSVPEPASLALLGLGAVGLLARRRRS